MAWVLHPKVSRLWLNYGTSRRLAPKSTLTPIQQVRKSPEEASPYLRPHTTHLLNLMTAPFRPIGIQLDPKGGRRPCLNNWWTKC